MLGYGNVALLKSVYSMLQFEKLQHEELVLLPHHVKHEIGRELFVHGGVSSSHLHPGEAQHTPNVGDSAIVRASRAPPGGFEGSKSCLVPYTASHQQSPDCRSASLLCLVEVGGA